MIPRSKAETCGTTVERMLAEQGAEIRRLRGKLREAETGRNHHRGKARVAASKCNKKDRQIRDLLRKLEEAQRIRTCIDCGRKLPSGHPHGYCPAREDSGY